MSALLVRNSHGVTMRNGPFLRALARTRVVTPLGYPRRFSRGMDPKVQSPVTTAGFRINLPRQLGRSAAFGAACALLLAPGLTKADPCEAPVSGYRPGTPVRGSIVYVGDGDSLCVGNGPDPRSWVEIRLADHFAPELNEPGGRAAKAALDRYLGRPVVCVAMRGANGSTRSYDRLIATCAVEGRLLSDLLRGVPQGGRGR